MKRGMIKFFLPLFLLAFAFTNCELDDNPVKTFDEALERIPDVELIEGADNATVNVRNDRDRSYFKISVRDVSDNSIIPNGAVFNAWCIELDIGLTRGQDLTGAKLYATANDPVLNKLAYIINNRDNFERQLPGLLWKDIQVAFWVVVESKDMRLESIADKFPSAVEGYNAAYVRSIISDVQSNGSEFKPGIGHTQLFLMNAGDDEQLTVGESNTAWARMNGGSGGPHDDFTHAFNPDNGDDSKVGGGNWATYIKFEPSGATDFPLYAGKTNFVGNLNVSKDSDFLVVRYNLKDGYVLSETHVHVGLEFPDDFPTSSNVWENPKLGDFDYGDTYNFENSVTESIPWDQDWNDKEILIAAHAVVWEVED